MPAPSPLTRLHRALSIRAELARFHTPEALLVCHPALWSACLTLSSHPSPPPALPLLLSLCLTLTLTHGAFCVLNDLLDARIDARIPRTAGRPLPSQRITRAHAAATFAAVLLLAVGVARATLGPRALPLLAPAMAVSAVYPLAKRVMAWPQGVLAGACGWMVVVGAGVAGGGAGGGVYALAATVAAWTLAFDTCYALQDVAGDRAAGNGSLALWLVERGGVRRFVGTAGMVQVLGFVGAGWGRAGWVFWVGVVAWAAGVVRSVQGVEVERPESGGRVFAENIAMGAGMSVVCFLEMARNVGWRGVLGL